MATKITVDTMAAHLIVREFDYIEDLFDKQEQVVVLRLSELELRVSSLTAMLNTLEQKVQALKDASKTA